MNKIYNKSMIVIVVFLIATIEIVALNKGINGKGLALAIGSLGGVLGYAIRSFLSKLNPDEWFENKKK